MSSPTQNKINSNSNLQSTTINDEEQNPRFQRTPDTAAFKPILDDEEDNLFRFINKEFSME